MDMSKQPSGGRPHTFTAWMVFDHPPEFPRSYSARMFQVTEDKVHATGNLIVGGNLKTIIGSIEAMGFHGIGKRDRDPQYVVGVWVKW